MMSDQSYNPVELITIEQNFPYSDPETYETKPSWVKFCQVYAELQIGQGREFWAAQKNNSELKGIVKTKQYIRGLYDNREFRVICSRGTYLVMWAIDLREQNSNELHLKKIS